MSFTVIIPARYSSQRLPGKPLLDICGKPMIQHVYERALQSKAERVVIATDDQRIADVVVGFGGTCCMTDPNHVSGTDRLQEAAGILGITDDQILVNVQGDEPLIPPQAIDQVASVLAKSSLRIATLCEPIGSIDELLDPNIVKVVMDREGRALYFSRAPIPWARGAIDENPPKLQDRFPCYRHLGIYAYRVSMLNDFVSWRPSPIEQLENLEQLRALWEGDAIMVAQSNETIVPGVDTLPDLERVRASLKLSV